MHEMSIAQSLLGQVQAAMEREDARRVLKVTVAVGVLSGVEPHALEVAFPIAAESAGLGEVALDIQRIGSQVHCCQCGHDFAPETPLFLCEKCESADVEITAGRELSIRSMEIES